MAAIGNAAATNQENYLGQTYHTASHEAQGRVDARLQKDARNRLQGRVKIPGLTIPIGKSSAVHPESGRDNTTVYRGETTQERLTKDGMPIKFRLIDYGPFITGYLTRDSARYGKLGITLNKADTRASAAGVKKSLIGEGKGRDAIKAHSVPETGIPKTTDPEDY